MFAALAIAAPVAGAVALASDIDAPVFARIFGRKADRTRDPFALTLGALLVALAVLALQSALALSFDPRYRDFPFAPLTAAALPFVLLRLQRARNFMSFQASDLSVTEFARIANYSVWRFIKVFFMVFGETPYSFVSHNRIDRAAVLLKSSDLAIGDVATAAGYDSRASFARAMKRHLGASASDFRRAV